jgi:hypothetical protein
MSCDHLHAFQVWRTRGLIRLYVGFMLFTLSDAMNPVKRDYSFEQWYMFYFYDLQIWEQMLDPERDGISVRTDLSLIGKEHLSTSSLGSTLSSIKVRKMNSCE